MLGKAAVAIANWVACLNDSDKLGCGKATLQTSCAVRPSDTAIDACGSSSFASLFIMWTPSIFKSREPARL